MAEWLVLAEAESRGDATQKRRLKARTSWYQNKITKFLVNTGFTFARGGIGNWMYSDIMRHNPVIYAEMSM